MSRRKAQEMAVWRRQLIDALAEGPHPLTLRQLFYRCVSRELLEKTDNAYTTLSAEFTNFRVNGEVPWDWLADNTRSVREPRLRNHTTIADAKRYALELLKGADDYYDQSPWHDSEFDVQLWLEKDALASTLHGVVDRYGVGMWVARGFSSVSFLHDAAEAISTNGKFTQILYLADYDPSGVMAMQAGMRRLEELCEQKGHVEVEWRQVALTQEQVAEWDLPTRPTKASMHSKKWDGGDLVELDAIPPLQLQELVAEAIEDVMPLADVEAAEEAEKEGREQLRQWASGLRVIDGDGNEVTD